MVISAAVGSRNSDRNAGVHMRPLMVGFCLVAMAGLAFLFGLSLAPAPSSMAVSLAEPSPRPDSVARRPILVELFTSQGCSSCPPADELLGRLAEDPNRRVIPLSFHVDYWNRLGWRDPFSSAQWSERQRLYNAALRTGRVYTPQLVVDGADHCVGSDVATVHKLIDTASRRSTGIHLGLEVERTGNRLIARVAAEVGGEDFDTKVSLESIEPTQVWVALTESGLETSVKTGENARRMLKNNFVVRAMQPAFKLSRGTASGTGRVEFDLLETLGNQPSLDRLHIVAFAQETATRRIQGAQVWPTP